MAFYQPGQHKAPPAEWMHAVLRFGLHQQAQGEGSQDALQQSYEQLSQANRAMLLLLLQQWYRAADGVQRQQLAMPDAGAVDTMLNYKGRRAAAATGSSASTNSSSSSQ
jgi:hypothetical protein